VLACEHEVSKMPVFPVPLPHHYPVDAVFGQARAMQMSGHTTTSSTGRWRVPGRCTTSSYEQLWHAEEVATLMNCPNSSFKLESEAAVTEAILSQA
jgi:hypothetical protein